MSTDATLLHFIRYIYELEKPIGANKAFWGELVFQLYGTVFGTTREHPNNPCKARVRVRVKIGFWGHFSRHWLHITTFALHSLYI
jgi:hypothetical protein